MSNNPLFIISLNILVGAIWHVLVFLLCIKIDVRHFDYRKSFYTIKKWEKNGLIYDRYFKIKAWKERLPQHIGKDGFSKNNIDIRHIEEQYLDRFLLETCRAEWDHIGNCIYVFIYFFISPPIYAIVCALLVVIFNLMCIMIQRYNRARLIKIKNRFDRRNQLVTRKNTEQQNNICERN